MTSRANSSIERRTRSMDNPRKFIQQSTCPTPMLGQPHLVEAELLRPFHLGELVADDVGVGVARRGLEKIKGSEFHVASPMPASWR
jgi:hypothetical protein